jgi:hypothetical protein
MEDVFLSLDFNLEDSLSAKIRGDWKMYQAKSNNECRDV